MNRYIPKTQFYVFTVISSNGCAFGTHFTFEDALYRIIDQYPYEDVSRRICISDKIGHKEISVEKRCGVDTWKIYSTLLTYTDDTTIVTPDVYQSALENQYKRTEIVLVGE